MKNKFLKIISLILITTFSIELLAPISVPAFADTDVCNTSGIAPEVRKAAGCDQDKTQLPTIITNILYTVIGVSGLVAVIFVIIGGINYMTSSGDSNKIEKAKKTILYACIGLAICALSFAIVNWTIGTIK